MLPFILMVLMFCEGHAFDYGTEFVTAFPENLAYYFPEALFLNLKITTFLPSTTVEVFKNGKSINETTILTPRVFMIRVLDAELDSFGVSGNTVRITSNKNISVVSISKRGDSIQTNVVYPTTHLGMEYLVPSPNYTKLAVMLNTYNTSVFTSSPIVPIVFGYRLVIINAEDANNTVTVTKEATAQETIALGPFQLVQLSCNDFWVKVESTAKVAVILTNPCMDTSHCRCNLVAHHVRPTEFLGTEFIFPPLNATGHRLFVTSADSVDLSSGSETHTVAPGSTEMIPYFPGLDTGSSHLVTTQPSLLSVVQPGLIINLIPNNMFSGCYLLQTTSSLSEAEALIIVETAHKADVHMDSDPVSSATWNDLSDGYSWAFVELSNCMSCIIWHPTSKIAVYVFEDSETKVKVGGPAISINDEPDPNGCVLMPSEYELGNTTMTWQEAREHCINKEMVLASPNLEYNKNKMVTTLNNIEAVGMAWLGLRRSLINSEWYWHSDVSFTYANWEHDQPKSSLCVSMKMEPSGNFTWSTMSCCSPMLPLCARDMIVLQGVTDLGNELM